MPVNLLPDWFAACGADALPVRPSELALSPDRLQVTLARA